MAMSSVTRMKCLRCVFASCPHDSRFFCLEIQVPKGGGLHQGHKKSPLNLGHHGVVLPENQQAEKGDDEVGVICPIRWEPELTPRR